MAFMYFSVLIKESYSVTSTATSFNITNLAFVTINMNLLFIISLLTLLTVKSEVIDLDAENFETKTSQGKWYLEFFAPWWYVNSVTILSPLSIITYNVVDTYPMIIVVTAKNLLQYTKKPLKNSII